jgi:hypothetical protein
VSTINCVFEGAAGAGTIPAAALAFFGTSGGRVLVKSNTSVSTSLHVWTVEFVVGAEAVWSDGTVGQPNFVFVD